MTTDWAARSETSTSTELADADGSRFYSPRKKSVRPTPFDPRGTAWWYLGSLFSLGLLATAWWQTSATAIPSRLTEWTIIGILAAVGSGVSNGVWLINGRRNLQTRWVGSGPYVEQLITRTKRLAPAGDDAGSGAEYVALTKGVLFHRASCQLVRDKQTVPGSREVLHGSGRKPCGMCRP